MVSSCFITRRHRVPSTAVGIVVDAVGTGAFPPICSGPFGDLDRLVLQCPMLAIWSAVSKLPQILEAASMPSEASDTVSIEEKNGKVEEGRALLCVLFEAAKLAWIHTSQGQSCIAHIGLKLQEVVVTMEVLNHML